MYQVLLSTRISTHKKNATAGQEVNFLGLRDDFLKVQNCPNLNLYNVVGLAAAVSKNS